MSRQARALGICVVLTVAGPVLAADLPLCSADQLSAYVMDWSKVLPHRPSAMPTVDYAFGTQRTDWGLRVRVRIDETGRVSCYALPADAASTEIIDDNRRAALAQLGAKTYEPFLKYGKPVPVVLREYLVEQELPGSEVPMPSVPLEDVEITLKRTSCYGACPHYEISINGHGHVVYKGESSVDVRGVYSYDIPTEVVAKLVESMRTRKLWSMRAKFGSNVPDAPSYYLTMRLGAETHSIASTAGGWVGMPVTIREFEAEVDAAARTAIWLHLTSESLDVLRKNGFKFNSREGADMLARAIANDDTHDEAAMLQLIGLGARIDGKAEHGYSQSSYQSTLENALMLGRESLVDALLKHGALRGRSAIDQTKLNNAFRAAIIGARLGAVQKIWDAGGTLRPSLRYESYAGEDEKVRKKVPVTLELDSNGSTGDRWEGKKIMEWLAARGCDLKAVRADGTSLLHIAAGANNLEAVRYLLAQGLPASKLNHDEQPPFSYTESEDVALALLEAGMDPSLNLWEGQSVRAYSAEQHWEQVVAWLDAHRG